MSVLSQFDSNYGSLYGASGAGTTRSAAKGDIARALPVPVANIDKIHAGQKHDEEKPHLIKAILRA